MYCRNCGAFIPEGYAFCEQCGTPVPKRPPASGKQPPAFRNEPPAFGKEPPAFGNEPPAFGKPPAAPGKRKAAIIAVIAAVIVCVGCICGFLLWGDGPSYTKKLETARQYVNEENYDQAEESYLELIADQPKKEQAYIELADVYMTQERYEDSVSILRKGLDSTGKENEFKKPMRRAQKKYSGVWKTAYRKLLQQHQRGIEMYEYPQYGDPGGATALCDINDDGTPELFFIVGMYEYGGGTLYVYSFRDGKAVELDVKFPQMNLSRTTEMEDHFMDVAAGGGTHYAIYNSKQDDRFIICSSIADEDSQLVSCEYTVDGDLNVSEEYWGHVTSLVFNDSGSEIIRHDHEYYHVADTIDQKEFDKQQKRLADDMKEVLITNSSKDFDDPILHKAAGQESSARFCEDMIRDLVVKDTDDDVEGKKDTGASADYSAVLDEYQSVFRQIMDGSYSFGDDISTLGDLDYVPESFVDGVSEPTSMEYRTGLTLQYAEKDLNGDGTNELLIGCRSDDMDRTSIDSIFTADESGEPVRLISCDSFMYRATLEVYEDGTIEYSGSGGATTMLYDYYTLPRSAAKLKKTMSLGTHSSEEDFDTIIYECDGDEISEKEFNTLLNDQQEQKLMKIDWKKK